jgi:hypothetical protein
MSTTTATPFLSDLLSQDELTAKDETYTKPVMRGDGQVVDPGATHVIRWDGAGELMSGQALDPSVASTSILSPYSPHTLFLDPCFMLDPTQTFSLTTLYLSLPGLVSQCASQGSSSGRVLLSLLNRARSKQSFMREMERVLLNGSLGLMEVSKVYMRVNGVYKQASIERQSVKKKGASQ